MNLKNMGFLIKHFRIESNLTQELLCNNICSVRQLSRIEKGQSEPSLNSIHLFSFKLGIDLSKYIEYLDYDSPIAVYDYAQRFHILYLNRNFIELLSLVNEFRVKFIIPDMHKLYVTWYSCVCDAYLNCNFEENYNLVIKCLYEKYNYSGTLINILDSFMSIRDLRVITSLAIFKLRMNDLTFSIELLKALVSKMIKSLPNMNIDLLIYAINNLAKALDMQGNTEDCLLYCNLGIDILSKNQSFISLNDLTIIKNKLLQKPINYE